jgi:hypothetical protein
LALFGWLLHFIKQHLPEVGWLDVWLYTGPLQALQPLLQSACPAAKLIRLAPGQ